MHKKKNKIKISDYLTLKTFKQQCEVYGADYSLIQYIKTLILISVAIIIVCGIFKLTLLPTITVILTIILMTPSLILSQAKQVYEKNEFDNVIMYMQQILTSFRRNGKLMPALMDCIESLDGKMHDCVYKAINVLNSGQAQDIYAAALDEIEKEYNTLHIQAVHKFLLSVEKNGGDCRHTLDLLAQDVQEYKTRTYQMQQKRKSIQNTLDIALILSVVVVGMMTFNLPAQYNIQATFAYQASTAVFFIACLIVHMLGQKGLNTSWLITDMAMEKKYVKAVYEKAKLQKDIISPLQIAVSTLSAITCACGFIFGNMWLKIIGLVVFALTIEYRHFKYISAKRDIEMELAKAFPVWLRNIILLLQTQNVHNAIIKSYDTAQAVLKPELKKLIDSMITDPASPEPYDNFLKEYDLDEICNTMKLLYSLNEFGVDNAVQQVNDIMKTNSALMKTAEEIKNSATISRLRIIWGAPVILTTVKMIVDMGITLVQVYLIQMSSMNMGM